MIPTTVLKFTEARPRLSAILDSVFAKKERVIIKKGNIPVAAIVSIEDYEYLERRRKQRDTDVKAIDSVMRQISAAFDDVPRDELEQEIELIATRVRQERRARSIAANT